MDTPSNYFALGTCYFYNYLGIGKKINALAKQKECEAAGLWKKSTVNLYWVAGTAPERNHDMLEQMGKSVSNHIQDVHVGHGDLFPSVHMVYWTRRHATSVAFLDTTHIDTYMYKTWRNLTTNLVQQQREEKQRTVRQTTGTCQSATV